MDHVLLETSPLVPGVSPVKIYVRDEGKGPALFFLHGGWGYEMYPFDRQINALRKSFRCLSPDRGGYGRSTLLVGELPSDFHYRAANETLSLMDSLGIERAVMWGHSDGAVIAAILGFIAPERINALILEAFHYYAQKPKSREFFETLAYRPEGLAAELCTRFARELGENYWRQLITTHAKAWLELARKSTGAHYDLYAGRLREIAAPTLFIHGLLDPRTEPGELDEVRKQLPQAEMRVLEQGTHSPHSEAATAEIVTNIAQDFLLSTVTDLSFTNP
jgi:pimeloyl-ACP methyl ester carboxylesterase